jgi:hypothetical protein
MVFMTKEYSACHAAIGERNNPAQRRYLHQEQHTSSLSVSFFGSVDDNLQLLWVREG